MICPILEEMRRRKTVGRGRTRALTRGAYQRATSAAPHGGRGERTARRTRRGGRGALRRGAGAALAARGRPRGPQRRRGREAGPRCGYRTARRRRAASGPAGVTPSGSRSTRARPADEPGAVAEPAGAPWTSISPTSRGSPHGRGTRRRGHARAGLRWPPVPRRRGGPRRGAWVGQGPGRGRPPQGQRPPMPFRVVPAADLHLDTPFTGLGRVAPAIAPQRRDASLATWDVPVELTLAERAAFLVLADDVYDGPERGLHAQLGAQAALRGRASSRSSRPAATARSRPGRRSAAGPRACTPSARASRRRWRCRASGWCRASALPAATAVPQERGARTAGGGPARQPRRPRGGGPGPLGAGACPRSPGGPRGAGPGRGPGVPARPQPGAGGTRAEWRRRRRVRWWGGLRASWRWAACASWGRRSTSRAPRTSPQPWPGRSRGGPPACPPPGGACGCA